MSEQHARLAPSNVRWPKCAGSVREEERYEDIAGDAAIDGTGSHLLLELCMKNKVDAAHYLDQVIGVNHEDKPNGWHVMQDRVERVQMALDYIKRRVSELKQQFPDCQIQVFSEVKADPGGAFGRDDWNGTCDITIIVKQVQQNQVYFVEIADYKDGRGYVDVKNNSQLISYLFGQMRYYIGTGDDKVAPFNADNVPNCRMTIIQPKTDPVIRYVCSTRYEDMFSTATVIMFAEELAQAAQKTDDPNATLTPGKHCQWCKANPKNGGHCTAESNQSIEVVNTMANTIQTADGESLFEYIGRVLEDTKSLTEEQLAAFADAEPGMQAVFDKVKEEIKSRIDQGIAVDGYAMQPGKGSNDWNDDEAVIVKKLKSCRLKADKIYVKKLISPAQMLKLEDLKDEQKERLKKELVKYTAGKKVLKRVAHTEQAPVEQTAEMMFGDVANKQPETAEVSFF
jgi:hypothetical protein